MITYNDYLQLDKTSDVAIMNFVQSVINDHKMSDLYEEALIADQYDKHKNVTITTYQKLLYTITGKAVPDNYSANFKLASRFFNRFIVQENQYLLANGVSWDNESTEERLGSDFDEQLQKAGRYALIGGVSFGFFNYDHLEVFPVTEFAPLYDEENGALMAGVRFWQLDSSKPMRATFYEIDGYTEYMWDNRQNAFSDGKWTKVDSGKGMMPKRAYMIKIRTSEADGAEIYDGENYPTFPIVPLWGNPHHQSELTGLREQIDCYDLIKSGFANTVDEGSIIYWLIQNAGGMDDIDLVQFVERIKTMHAAAVGEGADGTKAEPHVVEPPFQSREALLKTLRADLYDDAMALDTKEIANGAITATQIKAAYEPLNNKTDQFEYCVLAFLDDILRIVGIEGEHPTFTRSLIVNRTEEIQSVIQSAEYFDSEYVTRKLLDILGDGDKADEILHNIEMDEAARGGYDAETTDRNVENEPTTDENVDEGEVVDMAEDIKGKALNGAQTQSLIMIMDKYGAGGISESQAINMIAIAIGISKDDARKIVKGEE